MSTDISIAFLPHVTILDRNEEKDARKKIRKPRRPKPREDKKISQSMVANVEFGATVSRVKDASCTQTPKPYDVFRKAVCW